MDKLDTCLNHIAMLKKPKDEFEVIVMDNGSIDDTARIAQSYPFTQYYYDATPGVYIGRNRGIKLAKGSIICYIDDDSYVDNEWLLAIEETFSNPEVTLACGNDIPLYEGPPPGWLKYFWNRCQYGKFMFELSLIEFHNQSMKIPAWFAFGCNFIIRRDVILKFGGINPDRMQRAEYSGDGETAVSYSLNKQDIVAYFNPKIKIHHCVSNPRMTPEYMIERSRYEGIGISFSRIRAEHGFDYGGMVPTQKVDAGIKEPRFQRKWRKLSDKLHRYFDRKNYKEYVRIKAKCKNAFEEGMAFHKQRFQNDPELKHWVLRENFSCSA